MVTEELIKEFIDTAVDYEAGNPNLDPDWEKIYDWIDKYRADLVELINYDVRPS